MSTARGREGRGVERPAFPGARKGARVLGSVALATEELHESRGLVRLTDIGDAGRHRDAVSTQGGLGGGQWRS